MVCNVKSILKVVITLAALTVATSAIGQDIVLSPQVTQIEVAAGKNKTFEVVIGNVSKTASVKISIQAEPIYQNELGVYKIAKKPDRWSCADWITVDKQSVYLRPGEFHIAKCTISVPPGASGGRYAAITVRFGGSKERRAPLSASFEYVLPSYVELTIPRSRMIKKARIQDLEIKPVVGNKALENKYGKDAFFIIAKVTNDGNIGLIAKATLRIRDQKGPHLREVPLGTGRGMVLPGATVKYRSLFPSRPPPGVYIAEATLDYGGIRPSVAKLIFSVTEDRELVPGKVIPVHTVGLAVIPRAFNVKAPPGSRKNIAITLQNYEDYPVKVAIKIGSLTQWSDGTYHTASANTPLSCASWIKIEPNSIEIPANSRKRQKVQITVPEDASGSRYARITFLPQIEISREAKEQSYSSDIFLTIVPNVSHDLRITSFEAASEGRFMPINFTFKVKNSGNAHFSIDASVTIRDARGLPVRTLDLRERDTRILPGVTRTFVITDSQGVEAGAYTADLAVRIPKEKPFYSKCRFRVYD